MTNETVETSCLLDIAFDGEDPITYDGVTISYTDPNSGESTATWNTGDVVNDWNNAMEWAYSYEQDFTCVWFTPAVSTFLGLAGMDLVELDNCVYPVMTPIRVG